MARKRALLGILGLRQDKGMRPRGLMSLSLLRFLRLTLWAGEAWVYRVYVCFQGDSRASPHALLPVLHGTSPNFT